MKGIRFMARDRIQIDSVSPLLSTAQAAKSIGVSQNTLRRYVRDGLIPARIVGKKLLRFEEKDLLNLVTDSRDQTQTSIP